MYKKLKDKPSLNRNTYYVHLMAYLSENNIDTKNYVAEYLIDDGNEITIDPSKWPHDFQIPTTDYLCNLSKETFENNIINDCSLKLDVYEEIPKGKFQQGSIIAVSKKNDFGGDSVNIYIYIGNSFKIIN